jgi:N-acetylmuramoyl-L-alanine amidase
MPYDRVVISSGHGKFVRGAAGVLDEVDEARRVVDQVAATLRAGGIDAITYHDDISKTQNENLNRIVDFHNSKSRDLDISCHFNAYQSTSKPMGTEVLYVTQLELAKLMSASIASVGFINRGPKKRTDLFFLNHTAMPAILLEVCFVDSQADARLYKESFDIICNEIAFALGADFDGGSPIELPPPEGPDEEHMLLCSGKCSYFGGPGDTGVSPQEGLAFHYSVTQQNQHLFLPFSNGLGLARQLNPYVHYIACRWDYDVTPKTMLAESGQVALVRAIKTGRELTAIPADWGPHVDTGRVADLSPSLMEDLGIVTDDEVEVIYPWRGPDGG